MTAAGMHPVAAYKVCWPRAHRPILGGMTFDDLLAGLCPPRFLRQLQGADHVPLWELRGGSIPAVALF
jgi:hypothetical protein